MTQVFLFINSTMSATILLVEGIPSSETEEDLKAFFSDSEKSNGGEIADMKYNKDTAKCKIKFKDSIGML